MNSETLSKIRNRDFEKGDVLEVARLAGIMATKRTSELIPLCHPVQINSVQVVFEFVDAEQLRVEVTVHAFDRTGVEMEALTGASVASLTIYDMCKSVDRGMTLHDVRLEEKSGGKSGHYVRDRNEG